MDALPKTNHLEFENDVLEYIRSGKMWIDIWGSSLYIYCDTHCDKCRIYAPSCDTTRLNILNKWISNHEHSYLFV
jgi:hypothetical protein